MRSNVLYDFWRSRNTRNNGSWLIITSSCAILISIIAALIPLLAWNPYRTAWPLPLIHSRWTQASLFPWVFGLPLGSSTNMVHISSFEIVKESHMCWISSTRLPHWGGLRGIYSFTRYSYLSHPSSCLERRWAYPLVFFFQLVNCCLHLWLWRHPVLYLKGGNVYWGWPSRGGRIITLVECSIVSWYLC